MVIPNLQGVLVETNGDIFHGNFSQGVIMGEGTKKFNNGDIYSGNWLNGKFNKKGVYSWENGDWYEGNFVNGMKCGNGKIYYKKIQKIIKGNWVNDKRV